MIATLYEPFRHWSDSGSVYILSDTHFDDKDCKLMSPYWITPEEQIDIINKTVAKNDTFVCLGDVGDPKYIPMIKARKKILLLGNHDTRGKYVNVFDEIYTGPLFIAEKILLSHEPVYGLQWCLNIHGHDHNGVEPYKEGCKHINLAANVCNYTPISLGKIIKDGVLADIPSIHRVTIDGAVERKLEKEFIIGKDAQEIEGLPGWYCVMK
jgi:calcineurin-like phosphoesterase family protein